MTNSGGAVVPVGEDQREEDRPPILLIVLALILPTMPLEYVPPGPLGGHGSPARAIGYIFFALCLMGFFLVRRSGGRPSINPAVFFLLAYFFLMIAVWGVGLVRAGSGVYSTAEYLLLKQRAVLFLIAPVGVALYAMLRLRSARSRRLVMGALAVGLTWNCIVGLLQNFAKVDLHAFLALPGFIDNLEAKGLGNTAAFSERFGAIRAFGTSGIAIEFSVLAAVTVPLVLHFARFGRTRRVRVAAAVAVVLALLSVPAGVSRSGVIALGVAMALYMWALTAKQFVLGLLGLASAVFFQTLIAPDNLEALLLSITGASDDLSIQSRINAVAQTAEIFRRSPIWGLGLGGVTRTEFGFFDNQWMQQLAQGGMVGVAAMGFLAAGAVFGCAAALRVARNPEQRDLAFACGAMLLGVLSSSYTFDLFAFQQAATLFFLLIGVVWSGFRIPLDPSPVVNAPPVDSTAKPYARLLSSRAQPG